ncbi:MAG: DUF4097 family beta strand repeat-containing protein, partial [Anaerolineae bacterium]
MTTVERSFDPQAVNEIQVNLAAGDVQIGRGEGGQIEIQASFSSGNEHGFQADLAGGILYVGRPRHPEDSGEFAARSGQSGRANVTLTLPAGANPELSVHTGKGDVSASGVGKLRHVHSGKGDVHVSQGHGQTAIHTGLGDVAISHWQGDASVQTGKGAVHLDGLIGGLSVHTGAGDVAVRDWQAPSPEEPPAESGEIETGKGDVFVETARVPRLRIHTGRGDCHLQQVDAAKLEMQAGAGDMLLQGDPGTGRWRARTGSGDILLHLP